MQVFQTYNSTETQKVQTFQSTDFHANLNRLRGMRQKLLSRYMPKCKNCRETFPRVQKLFQLSENFSNCPETCPNVRKLFKLSGNFQTFWKLCKLSRNFLSGKLMIGPIHRQYCKYAQKLSVGTKLSSQECRRAYNIFGTL